MSDALAKADQLEAIERRIASQVRRIGRAFRVAIDARIHVGKSLMEAKDLCNHGNWIVLLKKCGLKARTAQECMQFAAQEALIKQKTHNRADLTVEAVRKMIASERKATGQTQQTRSASGSSAGCGGEAERTLDCSATTEPDRRCDATTGSVDCAPTASTADLATAEPNEAASTAATTEPTTEGRCGGDLVDTVESADSSGPDATTHAETGS